MCSMYGSISISVINRGAPENISPFAVNAFSSVNSKKGIVSKSQNSSTISSIYFVLLLPQLIIKTIAFSFQKYLILVELLVQLLNCNL